MADTTRLPGAQLEQWEWQRTAACRGMDSSTFFHPPNERDAARENRAAGAKAVCRQCPVIADCLEHALRVREPYGVWGGRTEDERAQLLGVRSLRYPALVENAARKNPPAHRSGQHSAGQGDPT
ncbi:MAG: WhiB family transcriptional regulator [Nakamurella sp.]